MAVHYFSLTDGSMEVHEDRIVFEDEAAERRVSIIVLLGSMSVLYAARFVIAFRKNDQAEMIFNGIFACMGFLAFIFRYQDFRRVVKQVYFEEIVSVKSIQHRFFKRHELIFRLKNGRIRRVALLQDDYEISKLKNLLAAKGILISGG